MAMDFHVTLENKCLLTPAQPTTHHAFFLCNIDQESIYPVESVYFFAADPKKPINNLIPTVVDALRQILVPYYFIAGRLRFNHAEKRMEIDCNEDGILFAAVCADICMHELGDLSNPNPHFRKLLAPSADGEGLFDTPLVRIQVTRFKCGGFAFGMWNLHCILDGRSATDFFINLGSLARGEGIKLWPNPKREALAARTPLNPTLYQNILLKSLNVTTVDQIPLRTDSIVSNKKANTAPLNQVFKTFKFTEPMLKILKSMAMEDLKRCSTFEAMVAHFWKLYAASKNKPAEERSLLFFAVDFKQKLEPKLPREFSGNGICAVCASMSYGELRCSTMSTIVKEIQKALNSASDEYVRSWTDWWEIYRIGPAKLQGSLCFSAWWRLPFYEFDLGWGKPTYYGPVPNDLADFVVMLPSPKDDGCCSLYLCLDSQSMVAFENLVYDGLLV